VRGLRWIATPYEVITRSRRQAMRDACRFQA
jgi:hypothetical protein